MILKENLAPNSVIRVYVKGSDLDFKVIKDSYSICNLKMRLSRKGWVSYSCEIRKGGTKGETVAYVDKYYSE